MKTLEQITIEERKIKIAEQQVRCEEWGLHHSYCKAYMSEYCPKTCNYAIKMNREKR